MNILVTGILADLRILVMLLLDTLPMLGNVLLLCFFVFFIFGIVGVQLWAGLLRQRCVLDLPDNISIARYDTVHLYACLILIAGGDCRSMPETSLYNVSGLCRFTDKSQMYYVARILNIFVYS